MFTDFVTEHVQANFEMSGSWRGHVSQLFGRPAVNHQPGHRRVDPQSVAQHSKYSGDPDFAKIFSGSISSILILLVVTNVSMAVGLLPVVGVTLPLISLGGSSLLSIFVAFGIMFSINRRA